MTETQIATIKRIITNRKRFGTKSFYMYSNLMFDTPVDLHALPALSLGSIFETKNWVILVSDDRVHFVSKKLCFVQA